MGDAGAWTRPDSDGEAQWGVRATPIFASLGLISCVLSVAFPGQGVCVSLAVSVSYVAGVAFLHQAPAWELGF